MNIVGFRTEDGTTYLVKNGKASVPLADEEWLQLVTTIEEGERVYMSDDKRYLITTPVEEIYYG